jgi:hypothetical protein
MECIWKSLIQSWRSQSLPIQDACIESDIRSFETSKITLPHDLREYFLTVNGMAPYWPGDQDDEGFSFWHLERIKTLAEEASSKGQRAWVAGPDTYLLFCDYLSWCWAYAIKIGHQSGCGDGIYLVCCSEPLKIADTFTDFTHLYLEKSDKLYPPSDHKHV